MKKIISSIHLIGCFFCFFLLSFFSLHSTAYPAPSSHFDLVQKIYIGYYQRPADPAGLIYWAEWLDGNGGNISVIIDAFANSDESRDLYGTISNGTISTVVNYIYRNLFARDAETAGLAYWVDEFNSGRITAATIMLNVLAGAQNDDLLSVNNKLAAAKLFTGTIDPELDGESFQATYAGNEDANAGRNFLALVTSNASTVPTQGETTAYLQTHIADTGETLGESPLESVSQTIRAAQGGTITLPGGSSVTIPPGAFATDQTVRLSRVSSLPKQAPSGLLTSVGPALVLEFNSRQTALPQAGDLTFVLRYGATTPAGFTGSAPLLNVVASDNFLGGVPIACESNSACFVAPLSTIQNAQSVSAASVNLSSEITLAPPPRFGARIWNGTAWLDYPQGFDPNRKTLVLTHGILSTVEAAFGDSVNDIMSQGGYTQVIGFNYDFARDNMATAGQKFADFLNSLQSQGGLTQIDLQAHSFGTLTALYAASQTDLTINNMILEGGPLDGTRMADPLFGFLTLLANNAPKVLAKYLAPATTIEEAKNSGMVLDAMPGNPDLKTIRTHVVNRHPETNFIKIFGNKSPLYPIVSGYIFGGSPNDGMVPADYAIGADLPGQTYIVPEQHEKLQSNPDVLQFVGRNLVRASSPTTPQSGSYTGPFSGSSTETIDCAQWRDDISATLTMNVSGNGTLIDPYRGSMNMEGLADISLAYCSCNPGCDPGGSAELSGTGTVSGSQGKVESSGTGTVGSGAFTTSFTDGTFSGTTLTGTFTFTAEGLDAPIIKTVTLAK